MAEGDAEQEGQERDPGPREQAVQADLERLASLEGVRGLATNALELARSLDGGVERPADEARLAAELRTTLVELMRVAPKRPKTDDLEEQRKRRNKRRGA